MVEFKATFRLKTMKDIKFIKEKYEKNFIQNNILTEELFKCVKMRNKKYVKFRCVDLLR